MRQGQPQNRQRSRGRGNNNRNNNNRNQLNRSMESNGPDVRIRGTAAHIAEKYSQLASDALTSGDTVAAQSYWQFAEHYNRLMADAQAAQQLAREEQDAKRAVRHDNDKDGEEGGEGRNRHENRKDGGDRRPRRSRPREDANSDDIDAENIKANGEGPQPVLEDTPAEVALAEKPAGKPEANEDASVKPRRSKRPRKSEAAPKIAEDAGELPSFVTGGE